MALTTPDPPSPTPRTARIIASAMAVVDASHSRLTSIFSSTIAKTAKIALRIVLNT